MSDMELKFCLHHLHANLKGDGYKGKTFKDALWVAVTLCNVVYFNTAMVCIKVTYPVLIGS